jgi:hypothetical protein
VVHLLQFAADDRHAHLEFRIADTSAIRPPSKREPEALLERREGLWRPVGRDDDLLIILIERVERVEKLFFGFFFAADELDIVDDQHVNIAIFLFYAFNAVVAKPPHDVARELFRGNIFRLYLSFKLRIEFVADRLDKMGLSEADAAIDEKRIIFFADASVIAAAAANASSFEGPTTNEASVYLGFNPVSGSVFAKSSLGAATLDVLYLRRGSFIERNLFASYHKFDLFDRRYPYFGRCR